MKRLQFRPRKSFIKHLSYLAKLDPIIVDEVRSAIEILLEGNKLPADFRDHELKRRLAGYHEFHLRDTPKGTTSTEINDVVVLYKIEDDDLILVAVDIGSHIKMFGHDSSKKYRK